MLFQDQSQLSSREVRHVIDVAIATAMRVHAGDRSPIGSCVIDIDGHDSCCYSDVTLNASKSAASMIGARYRFEAVGRPERRS